MKSIELRKDNWVLKYGRFKKMAYCGILDVDICPEAFSGIPISPSILKGCPQLEFDGLVYFAKGLHIYFRFKKDGFYQIYGIRKIGVKIKYLHQLQNRFQSFTEVELEVNLPHGEKYNYNK